jgi:hemoglobin
MVTVTDTLPAFDRIGGAPAIDRLVKSFYHRMETLDQADTIRAMHGQDLGPIKHTLKCYLAEWLGGPKDYSAEKGHPRLRQRHIRFSIGESGRDAWLLCMEAALAEAIPDTAIRKEIYTRMAALADWMRNQGNNPHDARNT